MDAKNSPGSAMCQHLLGQHCKNDEKAILGSFFNTADNAVKGNFFEVIFDYHGSFFMKKGVPFLSRFVRI